MGMRVRFAKPMIDAIDIEAVMTTLESKPGQRHDLTNAGQVRAFEETFTSFCGGGMAAATSSCMAALHLATLTLVQPGDEVIIPALTHPATALAVSLVGGIPVFVDVERSTGNITPEAIADAITDRTSAIMVLHYLGRPADMPAIMGLARKHDIAVIEDCALALGSFCNDLHVGLHGHAGCFSFYAAKHITTGEGGMLLTRYPEVNDSAVEKRHFGQRHERDMGLLKAARDWISIGLNYRMTEMQGALGITQMNKLLTILETRARNYRILSQLLSDFEQVQSQGYSHYAMAVFVPNRNEVAAGMKRRNVETSVYYHAPVPHTKFYAEKHRIGQFPNAEAISGETICFPVGPHINQKGIAYMADIFRSCL